MSWTITGQPGNSVFKDCRLDKPSFVTDVCFLNANDINVMLLCKWPDDAAFCCWQPFDVELHNTQRRTYGLKVQVAIGRWVLPACDWDPQEFGPQVESLVSLSWGIRWNTYTEGDVDADNLPSQDCQWRTFDNCPTEAQRSRCQVQNNGSATVKMAIHPSSSNESAVSLAATLLLILVCISWTITGQPRNSVLIRRVYPRYATIQFC